MTISRPQADEFNPYYAGYIGRVPEDADVFAVLARQPDELRALLAKTSEDEANVRPAPGEWSIKEVIGHVNDTERVFAFRALSFARADHQLVPGMDQNEYVAATNFNARTLGDLVEEFSLLRRANLLTFQPLSAPEIDRRGTNVSGSPFSVRALLYIMAGHVAHHVESLKTTYGVAG